METALSRREIAAFYGADGVALSLRTIDRCNAIGLLAEVRCMPPWRDPAALAEWYRIHYRSDPTKPPGKAKANLPAWILSAVARGKKLLPPSALAPPASPVAATPPAPMPPPVPADSPPPSAPDPLEPDPPGIDPAELSNIDAIAFARLMLDRIRQRYEKVKHSPDLSPAAERAYFEALEKVQGAERRAKDAGDSETEMRRMVEARIDAVHHRLPRHLAQELASIRPEVLRAASDPDLFPAWCNDFFAAVGERLAHYRPLAA